MVFPSASQDNSTDYSLDTWLSLVGLLQASEFFVTVDHSNLWRKHVTWSKSNGGDLRKYTIERFSSNMVFLSLMLTADVNVLFNAAEPSSAMRASMLNGHYFNLDYWTGSVIVLSACVTVLALVATFTAWGMVSSISDANSHCMLRSNIGQYVTSMPSRLVVASLYLFLLWLILFVIEFIGGPFLYIVVGLVAYLFFQIVVPLSTFGRLIIHTGAMGERPVLDPDFEKSLLPSGLHASLLIKATARKRGTKSVMAMYRRSYIARMSPRNSVHESSSSIRTDDITPGSYGSTVDDNSVGSSPFESVSSLDHDEERGTAGGNSKSTSKDKQKPPLVRKTNFSHHRVLSTEITSFPLPEILNKKVSHQELNTIVEMTLNNRQDRQRSSAKVFNSAATAIATPVRIAPSLTSATSIVSTPQTSSSSIRKSTIEGDGFNARSVESRPPRPISPFQSTIENGAMEPRPESRHRRTMSPFQNTTMPPGLPPQAPFSGLRRKDRRKVRAEWAEDVDVRDMYDAKPPALDITELDDEESSSPTHRRKGSFLQSLFNTPLSASRDEEATHPLRDNTESGEREYLLSNEQFSSMLNQTNK